jgi:hypothetical protein
MIEKDEQQYFTRYSSFTEKTKQRLEIYRRRSLPQTHYDSKSSLYIYILTFINQG